MKAMEGLRERTERFIEKVEDLQWKNHALGEVVRISEVYKEYKDLFETSTLEAVHDAGLDDRRNLYLFAFLLNERVSAVISPIEDEIGRLLTQTEVEIDGQTIPYNMVIPEIVGNGDRYKRKKLRDALVPVHRSLNALYEKKDKRIKEELERLGYGDYLEVAQLLRLADIGKLAKRAEEFLKLSRELYVKVMGEAVDKYLGLTLEQVRRYDVLRLFSGIWWRAEFPANSMVSRLGHVLINMGIDPTAEGKILIHTEPLKKKAPRAACFGVRIPDDVRLSVKPMGGFGDYDSLFHEMGHAQHMAHTDKEELEFRYMGSNCITEMHAFTLEDLLTKVPVLTEIFGLNESVAKEVSRFKWVQRLFIVRRYAAKLLYEFSWHTGRLTDLREGYKRYLEEAYCYPMDEEDTYSFLLDHDDLFYVVDYLRAWNISAALDRFLTSNIGETWYLTTKGGNSLKDLWSWGQLPLPEELARIVDTTEFDPVQYFEYLKHQLDE